jgi:hypothetical protein
MDVMLVYGVAYGGGFRTLIISYGSAGWYMGYSWGFHAILSYGVGGLGVSLPGPRTGWGGGKCRQVELGEEEMKVEVKNRRFPRRSEWK